MDCFLRYWHVLRQIGCKFCGLVQTDVLNYSHPFTKMVHIHIAWVTVTIPCRSFAHRIFNETKLWYTSYCSSHKLFDLSRSTEGMSQPNTDTTLSILQRAGCNWDAWNGCRGNPSCHRRSYPRQHEELCQQRVSTDEWVHKPLIQSCGNWGLENTLNIWWSTWITNPFVGDWCRLCGHKNSVLSPSWWY